MSKKIKYDTFSDAWSDLRTQIKILWQQIRAKKVVITINPTAEKIESLQSQIDQLNNSLTKLNSRLKRLEAKAR